MFFINEFEGAGAIVFGEGSLLVVLFVVKVMGLPLIPVIEAFLHLPGL